jgi:hypothetical protein
MKDKDAQLMMEALDVSRRDESGGTAQYDPGIHGPLDRVAKLVIGKIADGATSDYSISDIIDVSIEDVESEMGERQHDLNEPNATDKIKDLIIRNLSDEAVVGSPLGYVDPALDDAFKSATGMYFAPYINEQIEEAGDNATAYIDWIVKTIVDEAHSST